MDNLDTDPDYESFKRKSKSPSVFTEHDHKRLKTDADDTEKSEDIAKQYKRFKAAPKFNLNSEELFCVCRKPDLDGELMISCDGCEEWFHTKCMKIDPNYTPLLDKFFCKFCQWKGSGVTRWNRKCRMPGCLKPIRKLEKSKYCSDECGEKFLSSKITGSGALTPAHLSFVVNYCGNYADLKSMGSTFPELPEVLSLDMARLPPSVQESLTENEKKQKAISLEVAECEAKAKYLARVKEMIAVINEEIQASEVPSTDDATKSKKKKGKSKKIDLCCFQNDLNRDLFTNFKDTAKETNVREAFKDTIEEAVKRYSEGNDESEINEGVEKNEANGTCLHDRRKCLRHNGWFSLLCDRVWKRQAELQDMVQKLQQEKAATLRNYSIAVYEKEE